MEAEQGSKPFDHLPTDAIEPVMWEFEMATLAEADLFGRVAAASGGEKR